MPHQRLSHLWKLALALALMLRAAHAGSEAKLELWDGQRAMADIAAQLKFTPR